MAQDSLTARLAKMEKRHGLKLGTMDSVAPDIDVVSSGNIGMDWVTGVNGFPLGRTMEFFGPPSSGKTTAALQAAVEIQRIIMRGGDGRIDEDDIIVYLDYENAMDKKYAKALGLDTKHRSFVFGQPDYLEDGADALIDLIDEGGMRWAIVDSVAAMVTKAEDDESVGKVFIAPQAKQLKQLGKKLNPRLRETNGSVVFINHELEQIGGRGPVTVKTTPGGKAIKFFSSVRLQFTPGEKQYGTMTDPVSGLPKRVPISTVTSVKAVKNKVGPPFRSQALLVRYGRGFDNFFTAIKILATHKKITNSGAYYYFDRVPELNLAADWMPRSKTKGEGRPYIQGETALFRLADEHPEWRQHIIDTATEILANVDDEDEDGLPVVTPEEDDGLTEELDSVLGDEDNGKAKKKF